MSQTENLSQRWENYTPSKTLWFWSLMGAAIATMLIGFTVGGWTTGGSAAVMAEKAARDARAQLAASICVEKFVTTAGADKLTALKDASQWQRDNFVEEGGWTQLVGIEKAVPGAADLCATELVAMDSLPVRTVAPAVPTTTTDG